MSEIDGAIGRRVKTTGSRIAGLVACLPTHQVSNDYFEEKFGSDAVKSVVKMIGVEQRRWASATLHVGLINVASIIDYTSETQP